jgi:hypothetical protein
VQGCLHPLHFLQNEVNGSDCIAHGRTFITIWIPLTWSVRNLVLYRARLHSLQLAKEHRRRMHTGEGCLRSWCRPGTMTGTNSVTRTCTCSRLSFEAVTSGNTSLSRAGQELGQKLHIITNADFGVAKTETSSQHQKGEGISIQQSCSDQCSLLSHACNYNTLKSPTLASLWFAADEFSPTTECADRSLQRPLQDGVLAYLRDQVLHTA